MVLQPPIPTLSSYKCIIFVYMLQMENVTISFYSNKTSQSNTEISLMQELQRIKNGYVKIQIETCRDLLSRGLVAEYKAAKAKLPGVTYSGKFNGSHKAENLQEYSRLMIIDFDGLEDETIEEKKALLYSDEHVLAVWRSPSNKGLKTLIKTASTKDTHKIYFAEICDYLANKFSLEADKSGSDTCRICFTSYDPNIFIKQESVAFSVELTAVSIQPERTKTSIRKSYIIPNVKTDKLLFHATEGRNLKRDRETISKVIKYLKKRNLSITSNYQDWYRVGLAIANTFTIELGEKYYLRLCELDGIHHDEYKSVKLLDYCYRNRVLKGVNFSTVIYLAEQQGFSNIAKDN